MFLEENISKIGCHVTFKADMVNHYYSLGFRTFQFFIGSPQRGSNDYDDILERMMKELIDMPKDICLIAHAPYWYNFVRGDWLTEATVESIVNQLKVSRVLGVKRYVTHNGYRHSTKDKQEGRDPIPENVAMKNWVLTTQQILPYLKEYDIRLCYENSPGCKAGTSMGSIDQLLALVRFIKEYDHVGYCFDTQHAWANGEPAMSGGKEVFFENVTGAASVIHLNGSPEKAKFGRHLDRHSRTPVQESVGITPKRLARVLDLARCPIILERDQEFVFVKDLQWVQSLKKGKNDSK